MAPGSNCLRIVHTYTNVNDGTGESRYVTEDGRHWKTQWFSPPKGTTGVEETRYICGSYLCPSKPQP